MKPFSILDKVLSKNERRHMKYVGLKKTLKPKLNFTSLERKYYHMLKELDVYYVPQYPMGGDFMTHICQIIIYCLNLMAAFGIQSQKRMQNMDFKRKH